MASSPRIIPSVLLARTVPGSSEKPDIDLYNIAVRPEHSRQGIGSALIKELLDQITATAIDSIWLEVRQSNRRAIDFYEKHGFAAEVTRPNFYSGPVENAVIMRLRLVQGQKVNSM